MQDSCYSTKIEEIIRENAGALNMIARIKRKYFNPLRFIHCTYIACVATRVLDIGKIWFILAGGP